MGHVDSEALKVYTDIAGHASKDALERVAESKKSAGDEPKGDPNQDKQERQRARTRRFDRVDR